MLKKYEDSVEGEEINLAKFNMDKLYRTGQDHFLHSHYVKNEIKNACGSEIEIINESTDFFCACYSQQELNRDRIIQMCREEWS